MRLWTSLLERARRDTARGPGQAPGEQLLASLLALAWVVEARDPYTGGHLWRVSRYCSLLCEHMGLRASQSARIALGGFLHDLGKIAISDAVLRKSGALSAPEYAVMKTHPEVGARLLAEHPLSSLVMNAVRLHHERPDGLGYPTGLRGDDLPLEARVVGLCDAFDAMTSTRPYRKAVPIEAALAEIELRLGTQFDSRLGGRLLALGREGLLHHIAGHSDDGIPLQACVMCGPTLVVRREHVPGNSVFCTNCGGQYVLEASRAESVLKAVPTGNTGSAHDLQPQPDGALISRFVEDTGRHALEHLKP